MTLRADLRLLTIAAAEDLTAAHDHFVYARKVWGILIVDVRRRGRQITLINNVTGSTMSEQELLPLARSSVSDHLPVATIQQLASVTEVFLANLLSRWLIEYPQSLTGKVDAETVINAADKAAIMQVLIHQKVLDLSYKKPTEWFKNLNHLVSLGCPSADEIDRFAEFKATRDVFTHNRGIASALYLQKSGSLARAAEGARLDLPVPYVNDSYQLCYKLVNDIGNAAQAKAGTR